MRVALCAVVKNEGGSIFEWIAFHLAVGFDRIFIFDHGSTDETARILERAVDLLPIEVIHWSDISSRFQLNAYEHCLSLVDGKFDWIAFLDCDEFLVPQRDFYIKSLLEKLPEQSAIAVPWLVFGSSGRVSKSKDLITRSFFRRAETDFSANQHVKSIVRPGVVTAMDNPHAFQVNTKYVYANGREVEWVSSGVSVTVCCADIIHVNHYFVRSKEDWMDKLARGHQDGTNRSLADFATYDRNEVFDGYAIQYSEAIEYFTRYFADPASRSDGGPLKVPVARKPYDLSVEEFDSGAYLDANPDVESSSLSAVHHYFNIGLFENRKLSLKDK